MNAPSAGLPCAGLTVVEVAVGTSDLGLGLAGGVPGMLLADLGASVVRVVGAAAMPIDSGVTWRRAWHRDKRIVATDDPGEVFALLRDADVALVYGPEALVEGRGLGYRDLRAANPSLVYARCRPSRTSQGSVEDFGLLVEARAGFCTQLAGHRPGWWTSRRLWRGRSPRRSSRTWARTSSRSSRRKARRCGPPRTPSRPASGVSAAWR
ncbi:MAG TPA: CoA transferase [Streptosporangiaceae bacterium]|nr:CoA transferase [Streptosporangiaceae bacterium]